MRIRLISIWTTVGFTAIALIIFAGAGIAASEATVKKVWAKPGSTRPKVPVKPPAKLAGASLATKTASVATAQLGGTTTIDFEGHWDYEDIGDTYAAQGAHFSGASFLNLGNWGFNPPSGVAVAYVTYSESCTVTFDQPASKVTFIAGIIQSLSAKAYDANDNEVDSATGNPSFPDINVGVTLTSSQGIKKVVVSGGFGGDLVFDDFSFDSVSDEEIKLTLKVHDGEYDSEEKEEEPTPVAVSIPFEIKATTSPYSEDVKLTAAGAFDTNNDPFEPKTGDSPLSAIIRYHLPGEKDIVAETTSANSVSVTGKIMVVGVNVIMQDLKEETTPYPNEVNPGAYVRLNNDDDDENDVPDLEQTSKVEGENDLVPAQLLYMPSDLEKGSVTLSASGSIIKLWEDSKKEKQINLPKTFDLEPPEEGEPEPEAPPAVVWVEGVQKGMGVIVWSHSSGALDFVRVNVIEADLDIDSDNTKGTDAEDVHLPPERGADEDEIEVEEDKTGKILQVNVSDFDGDGVPDYADGFDLFADDENDDEIIPEMDPVKKASFVPVILEVSPQVDVNLMRVKFTYPASNPDNPNMRTTNPDGTKTYHRPTDGKLRIWRKNAWEKRNKWELATEQNGVKGDYIKPDTAYSKDDLGTPYEGTHIWRFWIEGLATGTSPVKIKIDVDPDGPIPQVGYMLLDEVQVTPIEMEFVVPNETYHAETANYNAPPVATEFVGVSDPRPTVELDEVSEGSVTLGETTATVSLSGVVRDPIADNIPRGGGADIGNVTVTVDGEPAGNNVPLQQGTDGAAAFWRQHPYKATMPSTDVSIPLEEGTHIIRIETSANAAGNTGFDEVAVTLERREVPIPIKENKQIKKILTDEGLITNIYIPEDTTTDVADLVQFYFGKRLPKEPKKEKDKDKDKEKADPVLTEAEGNEASLIFQGDVDTVPMKITVIEVFQNGVWATPVDGVITLDRKVPEAIKAELSYTFADGATMKWATLVFTETLKDSRVFRTGVGVEVVSAPGGGVPVVVAWAARVEERGGSGPGSHTPMTVSVKGLPDDIAIETELEILGQTVKLEKSGDTYYLKGNSLHIIDTTPVRDAQGNIIKGFVDVKVWDTEGNVSRWIRMPQGALAAKMVKAGTVTVGAAIKTAVYITSFELWEVANQMNRIANDYVFPEGLPVENEGADNALVWISGLGTLQLTIDRSQLILLPAVGQRTVKYRAYGLPPKAKIIAYSSGGLKTDPVSLDANGEAVIALPLPQTPLEEWSVYPHTVAPPYVAPPTGIIGKVVLFTEDRWFQARRILQGFAWGGGGLPLKREVASAALFYFIGLGPDKEDYETDRISTLVNVPKDSFYYKKLTHKVGVLWQGTTARITKHAWSQSTANSKKIQNSVRFQSFYLGAIRKHYAQWSQLDEGESYDIDFDKETIVWSLTDNADLFYAIADGYVSGRLTLTLRKKGTILTPPNISVAFSGKVDDLYDFNYFNRTNTSGNAAILQAGWNRFLVTDPHSDLGGIGRAYLAEYQVSVQIPGLDWVDITVE